MFLSVSVGSPPRSLRAKSDKGALGMTEECGRIGSRDPDSRARVWPARLSKKGGRSSPVLYAWGVVNSRREISTMVMLANCTSGPRE